MAKVILLAEDDEDNRDLMSFVVERSGMDLELIIAENGEEAIALAKEKKPDLILMDMQMPVMNGFEATRIIKEDPELKPIPVIAFTAQARLEDKDLTRAVGCVEHYTKPMDPEELLQLIKKYTGLE